jgi:hypothetical protein
MSRMKSRLFLSLMIIADLFVNTIILCVTYPIWREFAYQRHPSEFWIRIYLWAGIYSTAIAFCAGIIAFVCYGRKSMRKVVVLHIVITFGVLATLAIAADFSEPYPASSWPTLIQEIAAKFFAELQSIWFTAVTATSISIAAGLLSLAVLKRIRKTNTMEQP